MTSNRFPAFPELQQALGGQVQSMRIERDGEICLRANGPDVRAIVQYLCQEQAARVVTVFAEDRRSAEGVFYNHYILEQHGNPQYLIVRAPVSPDDPEFPFALCRIAGAQLAGA